MGEKEFGVAEQMKAVEAHIHKGAGCRCQELFIFFLLLFSFFCYPLDFFFLLLFGFFLLPFALSLRKTHIL